MYEVENLRRYRKILCVIFFHGIREDNAKFSNGTINLSVFDEDDNTCVLEKCIIPELHILQGFLNHVFWNGLVPILGLGRALLWPKNLELIPKNYHGMQEALQGGSSQIFVRINGQHSSIMSVSYNNGIKFGRQN